MFCFLSTCISLCYCWNMFKGEANFWSVITSLFLHPSIYPTAHPHWYHHFLFLFYSGQKFTYLNFVNRTWKVLPILERTKRKNRKSSSRVWGWCNPDHNFWLLVSTLMLLEHVWCELLPDALHLMCVFRSLVVVIGLSRYCALWNIMIVTF